MVVLMIKEPSQVMVCMDTIQSTSDKEMTEPSLECSTLMLMLLIGIFKTTKLLELSVLIKLQLEAFLTFISFLVNKLQNK
jgi:hypothetical protein